MQIGEGNIFEAMRLVLPEHRELMERIARDRTRGKQPILAEDQYEEMQRTLQQAIAEQTPICVTVWADYERRTHCGLPVWYGQTLRLTSEEGTQIIQLTAILHIQNEK